jgi:hypothetical protein
MVLKLGYFRTEIKNTFKVFKCGAGEGWSRSVGLIEWEIRKSYIQSRRKETSLIQHNEKQLTGMVTSCVRTAS